jgi:hypothetical protein
MKKEVQITTRKLLREFKKHKEMLLSGEISDLILPIENDRKIIISLEPKGNSKEIMEALRKIKRPRKKLKRPVGVFDNLFKNF